MIEEYEIRANFDRATIVVYQAYNDAIADAALGAGRFVEPFSFGRMTWIKPSFLWMMYRSHWASRSNQTRVLAVRITREAWEHALSLAVPTSWIRGVDPDYETWRRRLAEATIHVQWDPERSLRGGRLDHRSIQIGIGRHLIREYVEAWTVGLEDITPRVRKIRQALLDGREDHARQLLPPEHVYPLADAIRRHIVPDR